MTDAPKCEKCGSEMVMCDLVPISAAPGPEEGTASMAYRYKTRCRLDPKDCRIAELELKGRELQRVIDCMFGADWNTNCVWVCEEHPNLIWPHEDCPGPGMPPLNLKSERDAALAQVVVLRAQLQCSGVHDLECKIDGCSCGLESIISNTFATAQAFVEKVRREALEKAIGKMEAIVQAIPNNDFSVSKGDSAYNWGRHFVDLFRAAILGEKENN